MEKVHSDRTEDLPADGRLIIRSGDVIVITSGTPRWYAASERVGYVDMYGDRGLRRRSPQSVPVPQGETHAYEPDSNVTVCDKPLKGLHAWDDQPFSDRLLNRCPTCLARTRGD